MNSEPVEFQPFQATIELPFWQELLRLKLEDLKLETPWIPIYSHTSWGTPHVHPFRFRIQKDGLNAFPNLTSHPQQQGSSLPFSFIYNGAILNFNTQEDFKNVNRKNIVREGLNEILQWHTLKNLFEFDPADDESSILKGQLLTDAFSSIEQSLLLSSFFILLCYVDLKNYHVMYSIATPAIQTEQNILHAFEPVPLQTLLSNVAKKKIDHSIDIHSQNDNRPDVSEFKNTPLMSAKNSGCRLKEVESSASNPPGTMRTPTYPSVTPFQKVQDTLVDHEEITNVSTYCNTSNHWIFETSEHSILEYLQEISQFVTTQSFATGLFVFTSKKWFQNLKFKSQTDSEALLETCYSGFQLFDFWTLKGLQLYTQLFPQQWDTDLCLGYLDASNFSLAPAWPLRNHIHVLTKLLNLYGLKINVLCFKDPEITFNHTTTIKSTYYTFLLPTEKQFQVVSITPSWIRRRIERSVTENQVQAFSSIFSVNLREFLDPNSIQKNAVDLNLKLITWRHLPAFKSHKIQEMKILLIGAGTLGCSIARDLLAWGVSHITFVDCSRVSQSNPTRQSLFTHKDAFSQGNLGRFKVDAAVEAVFNIRPDCHCDGVAIEIPMPGHARFATDPNLSETHDKLFNLIKNHDVVMLLTDSRDSRWLPSLMVAVLQKKFLAKEIDKAPLCVTVALGFDSLLVLRHGYLSQRLSCYFCNDMTPPNDSVSNRALDQQCTVTRPGVSSIASGLAVELIASLTQHPLGFAAPHISDDQHALSSLSSKQNDVSCLGATPHSIRAFLPVFKIIQTVTEPFEQCICCSEKILEAFEQNGVELLRKVSLDPSILENISGLLLMKQCVRENEVLSFSDDEFI